MTWVAPDVTRIDEPFLGPERPMLDGWLAWQRATLLAKCAGLSGEQLTQQACPPSNLSLLGLIRHHADVERTWIRRRFMGEDAPALFAVDGRRDVCFTDLDPAHAEHDYHVLVAEQEYARNAVAAADLDATFVSERWGEMSLRWIILHLIEEYARHNGHADFLRESIDGTKGT